MNKLLRLTALFALFFLVLGFTSCNLTVTVDPYSTAYEIRTATDLSLFMTNDYPTAKLMNDVTITSGLTLGSGNEKTLNLNGKKITLNTTSSLYDSIEVKGKLTIIDDSSTDVTSQGWIISNNTNLAIYTLGVYNGGSLTINAGNFMAKGDGAIYVSDGTVSITKGCLMGKYGIKLNGDNALVTDLNCIISDEVDEDGDPVSNGVTCNYGIYLYNGTIKNINSNVYVSGSDCKAIYNWDGIIEKINGGTYSAYNGTSSGNAYALYNVNDIQSIMAGTFSAELATQGSGRYAYGVYNSTAGTIGNCGTAVFDTSPTGSGRNYNFGTMNNRALATFTPALQ